MNYYEHHIRDYDADTSHLTWDQDLAYTRLLRWYYRKERPIPADVREACRLARATSKAQRTAVTTVLNEYFELRDDGWHHDTCDRIIDEYLAGEPERELKKVNENNRLTRHREERSRLFKIITDAGLHAPWNMGIGELRELAKGLQTAPPETHDPPLPETPDTETATAPATPATATQTPIPSTHVNNLGSNDDVGDLIRGDAVDNSAVSSSPLSANEIVETVNAWERDRGKITRFDASQPQIAVWVLRHLTAAQLRRAYDLAVAARDDAHDATAVNAGFLDGFVAKALAPPRVIKPPLRGMNDNQLQDEAKRLGVHSQGVRKGELIARIEQKRGELRGGSTA